MKLALYSAAACALALPCVVHAAPYASYIDTQLDMTAWRTAGVVKSVDRDGDDVIGTLGYHLFASAGERTTPVNGNNGPLASLPGTISVTRNTGAEVQYGYAFIDNPVDGSPATILSGTTTSGGGVVKIATVDFSAGISHGLSMTLMHDNLNGTGFNTSGYTVRSAGGGSVLATITPSSYNNNPDWHYVDLIGLNAGDSVEIWSTGGAYPTLGAIAFDSIASKNLTVGTVIGLDAGTTAPTGTDVFNAIELDGSISGPFNIAAGQVRDLEGSFVNGVSVTVTGLTFSNSDPAIGPLDPNVAALGFNESHELDFAGSGNPFTVTFSGLDDSLTYDLIGVSAFDARDLGVNYAADGQNATVVTNGTDPYAILNGLNTDGFGNLVITLSTGDVEVLNALKLTAVPEPSSLALLGLGGLMAMRRRR